MSSFQVTVIGQGVELLGVFLLSAEAIKLHNIRKLRDVLLGLLEHRIEPGGIDLRKTSWSPEEFRAEQLALRHFFLSHYLAGLLIAGIGAFYLARRSDLIRSATLDALGRFGPTALLIVAWLLLLPLTIVLIGTLRKALFHPPGVLVVAAVSCFPLGLVPMALGELCHQAARYLVRGLVAALGAIEERTPQGTIGILGFLIIFIGKAIQVGTPGPQ